MDNIPVRSLDPASLVTFKCFDCNHTFEAEPARVADNPVHSHPYDYFANCQRCQEEVKQAPWEKGLYNAHLKATGPKTPEGKAASAANLDGHPTAEEVRRTRFNALKHGASAKMALYFPAKPGKYPQCEACDVDYDYCAKQTACVRRTDLMMSYIAAIETGDPKHLNSLHAVTQANVMAIFEDMLLTIVKDGASLRNPVYDFDKDGGFHIGKYTDPTTGAEVTMEQITAHPLLKPMLEMLSRNSLSLSDLNLTPQIQADQDINRGNLQDEEVEKESLLEYQRNVSESLSGLKQLIARSQEKKRQDPVLIEYQEQDSDG